MASGDGKYTTLEALKAYGPASTPEGDLHLSGDLAWAESEFERMCGSAFDFGTVVNENPHQVIIDRSGVLKLVAKAKAPVLSVVSVSIRYIDTPGWQTVAWDPLDVMLPSSSAPPVPDSWSVSIIPTSKLRPVDPDSFFCRWSYTAGYSVVPMALSKIIERMAWWHFKLKEAPQGRIVSPMIGALEVPISLPPDVRMDVGLWQRRV